MSGALFLLRHGEPEAAAVGRCYGRLDVGLSEHGRDQLRRVAERLCRVPFAAVYASPRRRALESATLLARTPVTVESRLAEIDFGDLEGLTYDEAAARHPEVYRRWMEAPTEVEFPGGESFRAMRRRVQAALAEIEARHPAQNVAVVSHGGVNRIALADALGVPDAHLFRLGQDYAAVNIVERAAGVPIVRALNLVLWWEWSAAC